MHESTDPPAWARRFLAWYCKPTLLEDLDGDLYEVFQRNITEKGVRVARIIYVLDVIKFMRSYTIRKPDFFNPLIHAVMIRSYVKTSGRNIIRNKLFSFINIFGLALSMSVGLIMIAMIADGLSYDRFHEKHDRIYRVNSDYKAAGNRREGGLFASTSFRAGQAIRESFTGVEDVTVMCRGFEGDLTHDSTTVPLVGFWADEHFFNVFSFKLLQGNPATALKEPFSILLTEQSALKLFGRSDVLGKTLIHNNQKAYTVTGVLADIPKFSHIKFDLLTSMSTRDVLKPEHPTLLKWEHVWMHYVYLTTPEGKNGEHLTAQFERLSEREDKTTNNVHVGLSVQPLDEIVTGENLSNQVGPVLGKTTLWILGSLTLVVVLSACFNYTNLSIARAFRRSKEVGIRKTIGALKSHVIFQFITESVIISLMAVIIALGLFIIIKPHFISLEHSLQELLVMDLSPTLIATFVLFAGGIGLMAGLLPALFYARVNSIQVLKSLGGVPILKGVTMRKVLLVIQYCLSIIAITATLVIYKQYKHFIAYDLGFSTDNIINVRLQGNSADRVIQEFRQLPEVKDISRSLMVSSVGNYFATQMYNPSDPLDSAAIYYNSVDENYIPLHQHKLIAGRNFRAFDTDSLETEVIVNMDVLKRFQIGGEDPNKALDKIVKINGKEMKIIGVLQDFEFGRANNRSNREFVLRYALEKAEYVNVKIHSGDWLETRAKMESIWKSLDPVHQLDAKFYQEEIEEGFRGLQAAAKVGGFLATLVIVIASIGLLGMVVFTTETRMKEISVRKVLGASEARLLLLLSKGFLVLLAIAACIAFPITYIFFSNVLLPEIANHAPLGFEIVIGVVSVTMLALLMIGSQTLKVARTNPAEVLKQE